MRVRRLLAGWLLISATLICSAAPRYYCSRPEIHCGLPERNYAHKQFAPSASALSLSSLPLPLAGVLTNLAVASESPSPRKPPKLQRKDAVPPSQLVLEGRVFQFAEGQLRIDHCSISKMAVQFYSDGTWIVNLQADQNPLALPLAQTQPVVTTSEPPRKFTAHLLRNQFVVRLRCYGNISGDEPQTPLGKPLLVALDVTPFWVERGVPYQLNYCCCNDQLKNLFPYIDRVQLEFTYRLADYEKSSGP